MRRVELADQRGIIGSFFIKLILSLVILGIIVADGASILFANLRADDAATAGATACAVSFRANRDLRQASDAGLLAALAKAPGVTVTGVSPTEDGYCTVSTSYTASTLVVSKVGFLEKLGKVSATETASPPTF